MRGRPRIQTLEEFWGRELSWAEIFGKGLIHHGGGVSSGFKNYLGLFSLNRENDTKQLLLGAY